MSACDLFYAKIRDLSKSDHVCVSESCLKQRRLRRTSEKEMMLLVRLRKVYKIICKGFGLHEYTVRKSVYNWRSFKTTVPSREVVDQQ